MLISALLNGCLEEEVYVRQPMGYDIDKQRDKVYKFGIVGLMSTFLVLDSKEFQVNQLCIQR
jgi:hypothetical protein